MAMATNPISAWMEKHGLDDKAAAERFGLDRSQVWRLRHGVCRPSIKTAQRLEPIIGVPAAHLLFGEAA
jgi:transcriptional regulator with XRE-family HTH domain